jgi:hypothetical protein
MIIYLFRFIWALVMSIFLLIINIVLIIFIFRCFNFEVDTREHSFFKPIDTLGEHGLWKTYFHWAFKVKKH